MTPLGGQEGNKFKSGAINFYYFLWPSKDPNEWRNIPFCFELLLKCKQLNHFEKTGDPVWQIKTKHCIKTAL